MSERCAVEVSRWRCRLVGGHDGGHVYGEPTNLTVLEAVADASEDGH